MVAGKLTEAENEGMFFGPYFSCVLLYLSSPLAAEFLQDYLDN
jgi:hypothetical protein